MVDSPKPSLDECYARITRAGEHIERLERELSTILSPVRGWTQHIRHGHIVIPDTYIPSIVRILIGETLYNLRTALDYLVSQLFYLATGKFDSRTKFIIEDSITSWDKHFPQPGDTGKEIRRKWLRLLDIRHQAALMALQPFNGAEQIWIKTLQTLSNIDKHRHFLFLAGNGVRIIRAPADMKVRRFGGQAVRPTKAQTMEMQRKAARSILFDNGASVIETLIEIENGIRNVVVRFDSDFK